MPWGRLDDGLYDHPKLDALGRSKLPAIGLWTLAISWSNRRLTDGEIPADRVSALGGTKALADLLVDAGLFDRVPGGYAIHDFLVFNDSRFHVEARREADRNRKRKAAGLQPETAGTPDGRAPAGSRAGRVPPGGGRPDPTDSESRPITPQPPTGGGQGKRSNGTNHRAVATAAADKLEEAVRAKAWRRQQRQAAVYRGALSEEQRDTMNASDAPVEEIPDWAEHTQRVAADAEPTWLLGREPVEAER